LFPCGTGDVVEETTASPALTSQPPAQENTAMDVSTPVVGEKRPLPPSAEGPPPGKRPRFVPALTEKYHHVCRQMLWYQLLGSAVCFCGSSSCVSAHVCRSVADFSCTFSWVQLCEWAHARFPGMELFVCVCVCVCARMLCVLTLVCMCVCHCVAVYFQGQAPANWCSTAVCF